MDTYIKLKIIRLDNGLTQENVAKALGITRSSYCSYEIGRRKMSINMLETLAKYYRMPISVFFNDDVKTVSDSEHYDEKAVYLSSLSDEEKKIVFAYRLADEEKKSKIMRAVEENENDGKE